MYLVGASLLLLNQGLFVSQTSMSVAQNLEWLLCTINDRRGGKWYIPSIEDP